MDTPKFLIDDVAKPADIVSESELQKLEDLVEAFQLQQRTVAELDEKLKEAEKHLQRIGREEIPAIMNQHGFSELRLRNKKKVIVKEQASVSVPDEKRAAFFSFLEKRNEQDIIKLLVAFNRMPQQKLEELMTFLDGYEYDYNAERNVHPQTLKAYTTKLLGLQLEPDERAEAIADGRVLRKADVEDVMNVFTFFTTTIK